MDKTEYARIYYQNNKERLQEYARAYYQRNKERIAKQQKEKRLKNKNAVVSRHSQTVSDEQGTVAAVQGRSGFGVSEE